MIHLNDSNGASAFTIGMAKKVLDEFQGQVTGCEMGIAYGGGVEAIGKLWRNRGIIYGFDTFEGHPKEVGEVCPYSKEAGGVHSFAATCMDNWYNHTEEFGRMRYTYEYIRGGLDAQGLDNVWLVKGLITDKTDISFIYELHYCFLDLDFPLSMLQAYNLVKNKIVKGGYLCLHDVVPKGHIYGCWEYYQQMIAEGMFEVLQELDAQKLAILRKK